MNNDENKNKVREAWAIPLLVQLLGSDVSLLLIPFIWGPCMRCSLRLVPSLWGSSQIMLCMTQRNDVGVYCLSELLSETDDAS